jgi:CBS domain-containing protein
MSTPAVCGYTGHSVAVFVAGTAASSPHRAYPVVDLDGRLAGLVTVGGLAAVPAARRSTVRLADVLIPLPQVRVVQPSTPLIEATKLLTDPRRPAVVVADGRPCGVLSPGDIIRTLSIAELGGRPDRTRDDLREPHFVS